jgi:hypothetical protein
MMEWKLGQSVRFEKGIGRGDDGEIRCGIVNGDPIENDDGARWIPVHVQDGNHNVMVAESNLKPA